MKYILSILALFMVAMLSTSVTAASDISCEPIVSTIDSDVILLPDTAEVDSSATGFMYKNFERTSVGLTNLSGLEELSYTNYNYSNSLELNKNGIAVPILVLERIPWSAIPYVNKLTSARAAFKSEYLERLSRPQLS